MKTTYTRLSFFLLILSFMAFTRLTFADPPPPPLPPDGGHGQGGNQQGAPIDGGLSILLVLGAGYQIWKCYKRAKND